MKKYDFDSMGALWANQARQITEKGEFVAHSGNWDLWSYSGTVYSIPVMVPAAVLPCGVLCPDYGGICTTCAPYAVIRVWFRHTGRT